MVISTAKGSPFLKRGAWSRKTGSALLPVLLALLHARIAREKTVGTQSGAQLRIEPRESAREAHAHGARLSADAATLNQGFHLKLVEHLRELQRLDGGGMPRNVAEIFVHRATIDGELRRPGFDVHAGHGFATAARAVKLLRCCIRKRTGC